MNWGYSHPIRRCLYGTLTRTNCPKIGIKPNNHDCITDHKTNPKSTIIINMLPTPSAANNSYDLLPKSSLLPSSLPTTLLYITWLSAHTLTHSSESHPIPNKIHLYSIAFYWLLYYAPTAYILQLTGDWRKQRKDTGSISKYHYILKFWKFYIFKTQI